MVAAMRLFARDPPRLRLLSSDIRRFSTGPTAIVHECEGCYPDLPPSLRATPGGPGTTYACVSYDVASSACRQKTAYGPVWRSELMSAS
eukprot:3936514-Rhodomonas_salina.6